MFDALPRSDDPKPELRAVAFYLPQYHPVPENDAFWGTGFTEWRNVVRAQPRFYGHQQPHLPADLGFYDLRLAEVRAAQADLARAAGLSGFCYYHYWFAGRRMLHRPFDAVLASGQPDFPFMLCWANENWTRAWDGGPREVLLAQHYSDADTRAHARHLIPAFSDPRSIRIDNRPAFAVYNTDALPDPGRWSDLFRETLASEGIDPFLIRVERYLDQDIRPPSALGFDAALEFQPFSRSFRRFLGTRSGFKTAPLRQIGHRLQQRARRLRQADTHYDMDAFIRFDIDQSPPPYRLFPGVCPSWDNSARRPPGQAIIFRKSSPELFQAWVNAKSQAAKGHRTDPILFVNAWNEWAEGNHLEPCLTHGHRWLEALSSGLGSVENDCEAKAIGQ
ncbi:MAG: glycoside hydrolase family 99-like domain-containing protein [Pseudomonadota bacterium]